MIKQLSCGVWVVAEDTHYGRWVAEHGSLNTDPHLFKWFDRWLRTPTIEVVWDIGANIGVHTKHYLDLGKRVVAFEPHSEAFQCLVRNCPGALCVNKAVGKETIDVRLCHDTNVGASAIWKEGVPVKMVALDDCPCELPMHFVKLDIEGCETAAIQGMSELLRKYKPLILCEVNSGALTKQGSSQQELFDTVSNLGYVELERYPAGIAKTEPQYDMLFTCKPQ